MTDESNVLTTTTLAIIAGGAGSRMGVPKAMLQVEGRPILTWLLDRLQWPGPTMLVTAPAVPAPSDASRFTRHVVDPVDGLGPLRGVLTALENAQTPQLTAIAVDMPFVDRPKLQWLTGQLLQRPASLGLMCKAVVDGGELIEPFPSAFRSDAKTAVAERLATGRRSLHGLCDDPRFVAIPAPAGWRPETWTNLNDRAALDAFETSRGKTDPEAPQ